MTNSPLLLLIHCLHWDYVLRRKIFTDIIYSSVIHILPNFSAQYVISTSAFFVRRRFLISTSLLGFHHSLDHAWPQISAKRTLQIPTNFAESCETLQGHHCLSTDGLRCFHTPHRHRLSLYIIITQIIFLLYLLFRKYVYHSLTTRCVK